MTPIPDAPHPRSIRVTLMIPRARHSDMYEALVRRISESRARVTLVHPGPTRHVEVDAESGADAETVIRRAIVMGTWVDGPPPPIRQRQKIPALTLSDEARTALESLCAAEGVTRSALVERLLIEAAARKSPT